MEHLRKIDSAPEHQKLNWSNIDIAKRWKFNRTVDTGSCCSECPCGKKGIRYLLYIKNRLTGRQTFVGSKCITIFEEKLRVVLKVALRIMENGLEGTYKGLSVGCKGRLKMKFEISAHCGLVKHRNELRTFLTYIPLYKPDLRWEIQVFPPFGDRAESERYAEEKELVEGEKYQMRLSLREWIMAGYGQGFSLYIISVKEKRLDLNSIFDNEAEED